MLNSADLEPRIAITSGGGTTNVEIDVRPFDPAPLIGTGGAMKFALQTLLAGRAHPTSWNVVFRNEGRLRSPRLQDIKPAVEPMKAVLDAACNHWKAQGNRAEASVETSPTTVVGILTLDELLGNAQRPALSRVARAIGKANGYRATAIVEKPALTV